MTTIQTSLSIFANSLLGWNSDARKVLIEKLLAETTKETMGLLFQGQRILLPVIRVPIEMPKYRMENGRTVSLQAEYMAKNSKLNKNFFSLDPEMLDAQAAQHELLIALSEKTELQKRFEDPSHQQDGALILDSLGFVVNGNRRLSFWRSLYGQDSAKYSHFSHVNVVVLPLCTDKDIDKLEAALQIDKDIKDDYVWDAEANMMLAKMKRDGFSHKDLAELYNMKESEIKILLTMRDFAAEWLKSRGLADIWSRVGGDKYAFGTLAEMCAKIDGAENQAVFKQAAFTLIDSPSEVGDSVHDVIRNLKEYFASVKKKLAEGFAVTAEVPEDQAVDLLGDNVEATKNPAIEIPLAIEIEKLDNSKKAREIIVEEIESQKQKKKDLKNAGYLLKWCSDANASLINAIKDGLKPDVQIKGVAEQLVQIRTNADLIENFLNSHVKN